MLDGTECSASRPGRFTPREMKYLVYEHNILSLKYNSDVTGAVKLNV
jgi:hypothetical protein